MDNLWERSIPFCFITTKEASEIFKQYDRRLELLDIIPIDNGCRNSYYKISTNKGLFILRICPLNDISFKKEKILNEFFYGGSLKLPKLLYISEYNSTKRVCMIYEYVYGNSLQEVVVQEGRVDDVIIQQVAEIAAHIHNCEVLDSAVFQNDYPPFISWFGLFLEKDIVRDRIGSDIKERVIKLIFEKQKQLNDIDKYTSFIHSDFRPANMMIDTNKNIWIIDWEYSGYGHSLADIGQFFRYSDLYDEKDIKKFEVVYNRYANKKLPSNWYELSKLRDLINPLQMLGDTENCPQKYADLKNIILSTLAYLNY